MRVVMPKTMLSWRSLVTRSDIKLVRRLCQESGNFSPNEVELAGELVMECLQRGGSSGYHFLFAQLFCIPVGYACYGAIPCTESAWDLYWLVVDKVLQRKGLGELILREVEKLVWQAEGQRIYLDTAGRQDYEATRHFYEKCGYRPYANLPDFYSKGDDKITYCKEFGH